MNFHSKRFDRAAQSYGAHARIQEEMAATLVGLVDGVLSGGETAELAARGILEMGCGTGLLTRRLAERFPNAALLATDAAPRMLEENRRGLGSRASAWALLDASGNTEVTLAVRAWAPFGLAASGAMVQWFPDLSRHFTLVHSLLLARGAYLVSGFDRGNFPELNAILREPPFGYTEFPGHTRDEIEAAAKRAGFTAAAWRGGPVGTTMPSARDFLESIRALGSARRPESGRPLTRGRLRHLIDTYQTRYGNGGVTVTWSPWCALLKKN